jgi:uncharacterized protein (DUF305 family)
MNNKIRTFALSAFVAATMTLPAAAQMQHGAMADTPAAKERMQAQKKMEDAMNAVQPTGDQDKDFVLMMIPHHQAAVDQAEIQLKYGKDPEMKEMAEEIVAAQKEEIDQMQKWLGTHK